MDWTPLDIRSIIGVKVRLINGCTAPYDDTEDGEMHKMNQMRSGSEIRL